MINIILIGLVCLIIGALIERHLIHKKLNFPKCEAFHTIEERYYTRDIVALITEPLSLLPPNEVKPKRTTNRVVRCELEKNHSGLHLYTAEKRYDNSGDMFWWETETK